MIVPLFFNCFCYEPDLVPECLFDLVVVALVAEILVELCGLYLSDHRRWTLFAAVTLATAVVFLALVVVVWESSRGLKAGDGVIMWTVLCFV